MDNSVKYGLVAVGGLLLLLAYSSQSKAATLLNSLPFTADVINKITSAVNAMNSVGISGYTLKLALSQVLFETGAFSALSNVASYNNNLTGIMYLDDEDKQPNASEGLPMPNTNGQAFYADFDTLNDWARDYDRILNLGPGYPINGSSVSDFVGRLKQNGYFAANITDYTNGVQHYFDLLTSVGM